MTRNTICFVLQDATCVADFAPHSFELYQELEKPPS